MLPDVPSGRFTGNPEVLISIDDVSHHGVTGADALIVG
jgi:hypothetical protein